MPDKKILQPSPSHPIIPLGGDGAVNAVWTYEDPYPAVAEIKDHVAFYPDRVDTISVEKAT